MSICPFDLTSDFLLISANIKINDNNFIIGLSIIDSYNKIISICNFFDSAFFTLFESIIKQNIPPFEQTNYYLIVNTPSPIIEKKINEIIKELGISSFIVETNSKNFKEKIINVWSGIKLLFNKNEVDNYQVSYNSSEFLFPLETLYYTITFTRLLNYDEFSEIFILKKYNNSDYMNFDISCIKCLNLFDDFTDRNNIFNISNFKKNSFSSSNNKNSVFSLLNNCNTKFGSRMLKTWLLQPLQDRNEILKRLNIVEALNSRIAFNQSMRNEYLNKIDDIQSINIKLNKFMNKCNNNNKNNNIVKLVDCVKLQRCIGIIKELFTFLKAFDGENKEIIYKEFIETLIKPLQLLANLEELVEKTIVFDSNIKDYIIRPSIDSNLTILKEKIDKKFAKILKIKGEIEQYLNDLGKNKKVYLDEYINVGYVFEINKIDGQKFLDENDDFRMVNSNKRIIKITSDEIVDLSKDIKSLRNELKNSENEFIQRIITIVCSYHPLLEQLIKIIGTLDILSSFSYLISNSKYPFIKPIINDYNGKLILKDSRHLILENLNSNLNKKTVSNECYLSNEEKIMLLTGINMGGKSTFLRQIGICVILAHIGMFLPATYAEIPLIDQIFTRVGAGDIMLKGISTYMNEMIEICSVIRSASNKSLLLIDELGRGTSTDDGVGISYAILSYICEKIDCYCLFATHFYELTEMEEKFNKIKNYYMKYEVINGEVIMEYKLLKGKNSSSFGVEMFKSLNFDQNTCEILDKFIKESKNN